MYLLHSCDFSLLSHLKLSLDEAGDSFVEIEVHFFVRTAGGAKVLLWCDVRAEIFISRDSYIITEQY